MNLYCIVNNYFKNILSFYLAMHHTIANTTHTPSAGACKFYHYTSYCIFDLHLASLNFGGPGFLKLKWHLIEIAAERVANIGNILSWCQILCLKSQELFVNFAQVKEFLAYNGNTSSMKNHLKGKHHIVLGDQSDEKKRIPGISSCLL